MPELSCGGKCMKWLLFIFNFIFFLGGAAVLGIGIWMHVDKNIGQWLIVISGDPNDPLYRASTIVLMTVGAFVFLVGFLGCCGACKESQCMLCTYAILLVLVFIAMLVGAILAIVFRNRLGDEMRDTMKYQVSSEVVDQYNGTTAITAAWNALQMDLECCGSVGPRDYINNTNFNWNANPGNPVPRTCCVQADGVSKDPTNPRPKNLATCYDHAKSGVTSNEFVWSKGCYDEFNGWMGSKAAILIGVGIGIAVIQIVGIIFACCLRKQILSDGTKY